MEVSAKKVFRHKSQGDNFYQVLFQQRGMVACFILIQAEVKHFRTLCCTFKF